MALNKRLAVVAFDRQLSGKGTAAATKKYGFGLRSGGLFSEMEQSPEELTSVSRIAPAVNRTGFMHGIEFESRMFPKSIGMLLLAALGSESASGVGDPYTHTITPATTLPYLTGWAQLDSEYHTIRDCKVDSLSIAWDKREPAVVSARMQGGLGAFYGSSFSPTNDETASGSMYPAGGTFQVDTGSATPATADIAGGELTIANHLEPIALSSSLEPSDQFVGMQDITMRLRLIPTDTSLWRKIITGTGAGTAIANSPTYGSFNIKFIPTASPERSVTLNATKVAFTGEYPSADPAGGPVELEIEGTVVYQATAFTATVLNDQNTTAYNGS